MESKGKQIYRPCSDSLLITLLFHNRGLSSATQTHKCDVIEDHPLPEEIRNPTGQLTVCEVYHSSDRVGVSQHSSRAYSHWRDCQGLARSNNLIWILSTMKLVSFEEPVGKTLNTIKFISMKNQWLKNLLIQHFGSACDTFAFLLTLYHAQDSLFSTSKWTCIRRNLIPRPSLVFQHMRRSGPLTLVI